MDIISVIVPVYKVEEYIHRCIDSILNQTYRNLEIILVDDGSPDKCGEICEEYKKNDDRVIVIHKKNGGLSDARNVGVENAKGDFITFVDSDDWIREDYVEKLYNLLKETNADITVCNFIKTASENPVLENSIERIYEYTNVEALSLEGAEYVGMVVTWGKLYKTNLFEGVRFPVGRIHEDEFTTYKLVYKSKKIVVTTTALLYYWQREDSIMGAGFNIKHRCDALDALKEKADFFKDVGLYDLSNKTVKFAFYMLLITLKNYDDFRNLMTKRELVKKYYCFRDALRCDNNKLSYKILYEMFFMFPGLTDKVHGLYISTKK